MPPWWRNFKRWGFERICKMSNFVGFKDGKSFVLDEHIEAVRLAKVE